MISQRVEKFVSGKMTLKLMNNKKAHIYSKKRKGMANNISKCFHLN